MASTRSVLQTLSKQRVLEIVRAFAIDVVGTATRDGQVAAVLAASAVSFRELAALGR